MAYLRESVELINASLEYLMSYDAKGFHKILKGSGLIFYVKRFLSQEFEEFLRKEVGR